MMNAFCKQPVLERYLPKLLKDLEVLFVGTAGSGICAGITLAEAGINF